MAKFPLSETVRGKSYGPLVVFLVVLVFWSSHVKPSEGANILLASHGFPSHMRIIHIIGEDLVKKGHKVYTIAGSHLPMKGVKEKGIEILRFNLPPGGPSFINETYMELVTKSFLEGVDTGVDDSAASCDECSLMDADPALNAALNRIKFDLVLVDIFPVSYCMLFIPLKLGVPFIPVAPCLEMDMMRIPLFPSFVPSVILPYTDRMNFMDRFKNFLFFIPTSFSAFSMFKCARNTSLLEKYSRDPDVTTWHSLGRKASMYFLTRGDLLESPVPLMPHVVPIEGITATPAKPLASEILQMVANNKHGVVVVSFGSFLKKVPMPIAKKLVDAFRQRKELFFWRLTGNIDTKALNLPDNVKLMSWLPQNDLLAHPNTVLFITHSGNNGHYEALYHGVPMIAAPLSIEQIHNAERITNRQFGLTIKITDFSVEELLGKMSEVIGNKMYTTNIKKAASLMKARPMNPQELSSYWIEHILEFGSDHLRSHASDMPWYSFYMFDIFGFVFFIIALLISVVITLCCCAYQAFSKSNKKVKMN